jgi:hypothetical protein
MKKAAIVLSLCLLFTSVGVGQDEELLDLIALKAAKAASRPHNEETSGVGSGVGYASNEKRPRCPVKITLAQLDRASYRIGDRLVYEAVVENVSEEKILLPASVEGSEEEFAANARYLANYSAYSRAYLSLAVKTELSEYPQIFVIERLYGVETAPESYRILLPGQKLRIRGQGSVSFGSGVFFEKLAPELPRKYEVQVAIEFYHFRDRVPAFIRQFDKPAVSTNSVTIELRKYEPPDQSPSQ